MRHLAIAVLASLAVSACAGKKETVGTAASTAAEAPAAPAPQAASDADFLLNAANSRVFFEYDSWQLTDAARDVLRRQAAWLARNPSVSVVIEGHCDERGTREYNLGLGDRRAYAVQAFLVDAGVDRGRLRTVSYGKDRPEVAGSSENAWSRNRRGVTTIAR